MMKISDREVYYNAFYSKTWQHLYHYMDIREDIKNIIRNYFKQECEIYYLGSRIIGIADNEESDLDFFIDVGKNTYFRDRNYQYDLDNINYLSRVLMRSEDWKFKRFNASIPSIKFVHIQTKIKCDISMTNGMSVHNSYLLAHLFDIQPEMAPFYHYIKNWLKLFNVKFKGFTLTLLVIFYFQTKKYLPSIRKVQRLVEPIEFIDGFEVQFDDTRTRDDYGLKELKYYKDHLKDFFKFYSKFSYETKVICPYSGNEVDKCDYKYRIENTCAVTLAAPLLRRHNCAKYLSNLDLVNFINACDFSAKYLDEYKIPKSMMNDYKYFENES
ncbi:hypothetical protein PVAND_006485 [Polypedilum vanderplanki]|uniref:Poly(A) RNA polymerase mitochondrial-like central palm domain-containing protein n=1 Tax=Polypedilum vanderplanki TaxID=319348 RepID=A0A9J6C4B6_POLVA|nr:hypothetical protein PVAND_006485 [Polypedilum vanderplanki]